MEFNGLPGSGKTTLANLLKSKLDLQGHKTFLRYYKHSFPYRHYCTLFLPHYYRLIYLINQYSHSFSTRKSLIRKLSIVNYVKMYIDFVSNNKSGILIIDQGILQSIVSLAFDELFPDNDKLIAILQECGIGDLPLVIVNCSVPLAISEERIEKRGPKSSGFRLDSLDVEKRVNVLETESVNFETIRCLIGSSLSNVMIENLDLENNIEHNLDLLLKLVSNTEK